MQPFKQTESGYTETAKTVVFGNEQDYNTALLDNPVRKKVNAAMVQANVRSYTRGNAI